MTDFVIIELRAGDGGMGKVSFRREWRVPKGGPDGGDGGDGGHIILQASSEVNSLDALAGKTFLQAEAGGGGGKRKRSGKRGDDLKIQIPVGTVVWQITENQAAHLRRLKNGVDALSRRGETQLERYQLEQEGEQVPNREKDELLNEEKIGQIEKAKEFKPDQQNLVKLVDFSKSGQEVVLCQGGFGGRGNVHFKSSVNTTPLVAEYGGYGEKRAIVLELKLLADVGFVGFPNAGKSTLLSRLTKAQPKIAAYPFTTLEPHLGIYQQPKTGQELVLADIPGLIAGAHQGKGLGFQFLRHIENCEVLLFVLALNEEQLSLLSAGDDSHEDGEESLDVERKMADQLIEQWQQLEQELVDYKAELKDKKRVVILNKSDLYSAEFIEQARKAFADKGVDLLVISAATGDGLDELHQKLI